MIAVQFAQYILRQWDEFWFSKISALPYSVFRVAHGLALGLFLAAWWRNAPEWLTPAGFHFPYEDAPPLPTAFLPWFAVLQFGSLILFILDWKPRCSAFVTWLCVVYVTSVDHPAAFSINNIFLFTFAILAVFPYPGRNQSMLAAPIRLLQLGMVVIYFSSGWHKIVWGDWLSSPHVLETSMKGTYMTEAAAWALRHLPGAFWTVGQAFVLMFELFSPVLFFSRKLQPVAIFCGCLFHLGIAVFMHELIYFSLQMMSFYILFIPFEGRLSLRRKPEFSL